jgi:pimeloyl-ACP methyl ester carboxylesterase
VYGAGEVTVLLLPTWQIIDSRFWKAQVGYLARHFRVVTFDARGSGGSDRPSDAAAYSDAECAADIPAVLNATGTDRAVLVGLSCGSAWAVRAAADHPDRVLGIVAIGPACGLGVEERERSAWDGRHETTRGWAMYNRHYWLNGGLPEFLPFFFGQMFPSRTPRSRSRTAWTGRPTSIRPLWAPPPPAGWAATVLRANCSTQSVSGCAAPSW